MSASHFLDTNVLVYSFDRRSPEKREIAHSLVERALAEGSGLISFQVVQEFLNVASRRFARPLEPDEATEYLERVLAPLCRVFPSIGLYRAAIGLADRWRYSFFDSLILASARTAGCSVLYSEDLQHGQEVEGLRIENPFLEAG